MAKKKKSSSEQFQDAASATAPKDPAAKANKDGFRELVETIVFVVVLVVLLKMFLAEAFVIPTGSMAPTLYGYHMDDECQKCGYPLHPNAAQEADPQPPRQPELTEFSVCPNCRYYNKLKQ